MTQHRCQFPDRVASTAYRYGCRCDRCRIHRRDNAGPQHNVCKWCAHKFIGRSRNYCYDCVPERNKANVADVVSRRHILDAARRGTPISQLLPADHPARLRTCKACGEQFYPDAGNRSKGRGNTCSRACANRARPTKALKTLAPPTPPASRIYVRDCVHCDRPFVSRHAAAKWCSRTCGNKARIRGDANRAAEIMKLYYIATSLGPPDNMAQATAWRHQLVAYLASRDGNRCQICRRFVDMNIKSGPRGSDNGASIDHIVPVSQGGLTELANLRLTHWGCNRNRGNRGGNEQLRLVG